MRSEIDRRLSALKQIRDDADYYAVVLTADDSMRMQIAMFSHWVGYADEQCREELREPSIVNAKAVAKTWKNARQPYAVVNQPNELMLFLVGGGNALIEKGLLDTFMPRFVKPKATLPEGISGFTSIQLFDAKELKRAPTPKMRMQVLKRDGRHCRICGRRPDDCVDVELHVHHIRPWERGGATKANNLITLCHTCHKGLHPHFDESLLSYVQDRPTVASRLRALMRGVANYRKASARIG